MMKDSLIDWLLNQWTLSWTLKKIPMEAVVIVR